MAIYNGTQKVDISGVDKVYVGSQLVYQKVNKQVVSIEVTDWPYQTNDNCFTPVTQTIIGKTLYAWYQETGSTFSFPGTITATYDDNSTADVTSQCTFSGYNMSTESNNTGYGLTVSYTYNGTTVTIPNYTLIGNTVYTVAILVKKVADYITLSNYTTQFYTGDTYSYGGTVTAHYTDGTSATATSGLSYTGYDMSTAGNQTVTVTYTTTANWLPGSQTKTTASVVATYNITVTQKTLSSISISGQTTSLNRGASFSFGGTVYANFNNGAVIEDVTSSATFSGYNMSKAGTYTVTVSYTYNGVTKTTTYSLTVNRAWSTAWSGSKKVGYGGTTSDFTFTNKSYDNNLKIRITFSGMTTYLPSGDSGSSSFTPSNKTSPTTISSFDSLNLTTLISVSANNTSRSSIYTTTLYYNKSNGNIYSHCSIPTNTSYARSYVTITKVELYY